MERQKMNEADKTRYLSSVANRIKDPEILTLIKEDMEWGLSQKEIDVYLNRKLKNEQRQAISDMWKRNYPEDVVAVFGAADIDAERMRLAMTLYESNIPVSEIKEALENTKTARDMRLAFDMALAKVQKVSGISREAGQGEVQPDELTRLMGTLRELSEALQSHGNDYKAISEMQKAVEDIRIDEAVLKNLTSLNDRLNAENKELSGQLEDRQNEIAKGMQSISRLRKEAEEMRKEVETMKERIHELEEQAAEKDRTIQKMEKENASVLSAGQGYGAGEGHSYHTIQTEGGNGKDGSDRNDKGGKSGEAPGSIPVHYCIPVVKDGKVVDMCEVEQTVRKPERFETLIGSIAFHKKKARKNFVKMLINGELSPEQVNEIRGGLEKGLNEEQLELIINKNLSPERIKSIVGFAALQNSLNKGVTE